MVHYIKKGKSAEEKRDLDRQISHNVETILADIEQRGWVAIREYSENLTNGTRYLSNLVPLKFRRVSTAYQPRRWKISNSHKHKSGVLRKFNS